MEWKYGVELAHIFKALSTAESSLCKAIMTSGRVWPHDLCSLRSGPYTPAVLELEHQQRRDRFRRIVEEVEVRMSMFFVCQIFIMIMSPLTITSALFPHQSTSESGWWVLNSWIVILYWIRSAHVRTIPGQVWSPVLSPVSLCREPGSILLTTAASCHTIPINHQSIQLNTSAA